MPKLRHFEHEGDEPDAKKFVPGTKELEEATAYETFRRTSQPEVSQNCRLALRLTFQER